MKQGDFGDLAVTVLLKFGDSKLEFLRLDRGRRGFRHPNPLLKSEVLKGCIFALV